MVKMAVMVIMAVIMILADAYADRTDMYADHRGIRSANHQTQGHCRSNKSFHGCLFHLVSRPHHAA